MYILIFKLRIYVNKRYNKVFLIILYKNLQFFTIDENCEITCKIKMHFKMIDKF